MKIKKIYPLILKTKFLLLFSIISSFGISQNLNFTRHWEDLGPYVLPTSKNNSPTAGTGPIEFIKVSQNNSNNLLAGSLFGGLFYSENGGESWLNAGSDSWSYSTCSWASFHPDNDSIWFATSIIEGENGKPGKIGKLGGVYKSINKGLTWMKIGNYSHFGGSPYTKLMGIRFHPTDHNKLYALTSKGLYFTEDCSSNNITWFKVNEVKGLVYDVAFHNGNICISSVYKNKWTVHLADGYQLKPINKFINESREIAHVTIESSKDYFYFLVDFKSGKDEIWQYDQANKDFEVVCTKGRTTFGAGYTFAINPFNEDEIVIGNGLRVRKWVISEGAFESFGNNYHVDVEHVAFDPKNRGVIYIGTHGGVYKTINDGIDWQFKSEGIGIAEVFGMAVSETNPEQIVIGLNHDGSVIRTKTEGEKEYTWKLINGGDALLPLINPNSENEVYTSNQYTGGGLYFSEDKGENNINIHKVNGIKTAGWSMACVLHPTIDSILFFNFLHPKGVNNSNIDAARSFRNGKKGTAHPISNFKTSHGFEKYMVYSLFNSVHHPDILLAYVLVDAKNKKGKMVKEHRLFLNDNCLDTVNAIMNWREIELPRKAWLGDVVMDSKRWNKMYFSYVVGEKPNIDDPTKKGMVFYGKYKKSTLVQTRDWDISANIPSSMGGKYNLVYTSHKSVFVATRTGVYFGNSSTLKGGKPWQKIGVGLPNCRVYGLHYHEGQQLLTVGLKGRGVWRIYLGD